MKIRSAEFIKSCLTLDQCPKEVYPEIALLGRSNVGKSSALNCLLNRKGLAKVGKIPGKTQMINFFHVQVSDSQVNQFRFVDLPGYGYAKVPQSLRQAWGPMIESYLTLRQTICGVVIFIDIRRVERSDEDLFQWLKTLPHAVVVVATKMDKISAGQRRAHLDHIRKELSLPPHAELLSLSSHTQEGRTDVIGAIKNLIVAHI